MIVGLGVELVDGARFESLMARFGPRPPRAGWACAGRR